MTFNDAIWRSVLTFTLFVAPVASVEAQGSPQIQRSRWMNERTGTF